MLYPGFVSGSYESQSPFADLEKTVNWYPEPIEPNSVPWSSALYPCPGFTEYVTVANVNTRALFSMAGRVYAVIGNTVYQVFANNTAVAVTNPTVANNPSPAQIASNGDAGGELLIASGTNGYLLTISSNTLTTIANLAGKCTMAGMIDGYFLAFDSSASKFFISGLNDGTTWDATQYAQRSIAPDPWKAMVVDGSRQIWLIGEQTGEVWYDAGTSPFPFAPVPGAVFGYGTPAPFSVKLAGSTMCWLSQTADGAGIVVGATGVTPQRISTYAVETAIASYARDFIITDAEAVVYSEAGHTFYCLSFPSANQTWVFDLTTGLWHQRGVRDDAAGDYDVWAPRNHCYGFGRHLIGDRTTGKLCTMDTSMTAECDGTLMRRLRIPPPMFRAPGVRRMFVSRMELVLESGLGTSSGQGSDPQVMLRSSINAKTWSNERLAAAGAAGAYNAQVVWTRLPSSVKMWVPEITVTDPIPWRIMGAEIDGRGFFGQEG